MKEKNRKLAEFLGWKKQNAGKFIVPDVLIEPSRRIYSDLRFDFQLEFNTNWNWLMLVFEKIETTKFDITNTKKYVQFPEKFKNIKEMLGDILLVYDDREEFKGWSYNVSFSLFPVIDIASNDGRYETKKECAVDACIAFIDYLNENNIKY